MAKQNRPHCKFFLWFFFQMTEVLKAGVLSDEIDLGALAHNAAEQAEEFVRKVSSFNNKVIIK